MLEFFLNSIGILIIIGASLFLVYIAYVLYFWVKLMRTMLASMRESEAIIQDADYVMLLDRPEQRDCLTAEYLGAQVSAIGRGFVYLRKARNGRTGTVIMNYVAEIGKFENLPQEIQL